MVVTAIISIHHASYGCSDDDVDDDDDSRTGTNEDVDDVLFVFYLFLSF